jgi:CRP-like cAMP-binding protein
VEATVRALVATQLWCMTRQSFRDVVTSLLASQHRQKCRFFRSVPIFSALSDAQAGAGE